MDSIRVSDIPNPREKASPLSILLWWWVIAPCRAILQKKLTVDNLYNPLEEDRSTVLGDRLEKQWNAELQRASKHNTRPNLARSILFTFHKEISWQIFLQLLAGLILKLCPPLLLGQLMFYFTSDASMTRNQGLAYAGLFCLANLANFLSLKHYNNHSIHTGMKIRVAVVSLIYRKALKLNQSALSSDTSTGAIVNIVANDVNRLNQMMIYVHYIWSAPLLTIAVSGLVYVQVGFTALIGVAVLLTLVFIQVYMGKLLAEQRHETASKTDERVRLIDEIISGVQVIKMYAWEKPFCALVELARRLELKVISKTCYPRSFSMTSYIFATRLALFFALVLMVYTNVPLVPREIFLVASFYNSLAESLIAQLVRGYSEIVEGSVTIARVKSFLTLSECKREDNVHFIKNISPTSRKKANDAVFEIGADKSIILKDLTIKWRPEAPNAILKSINLQMDKGKLYAVIGRVGSGKSSLLAAILGETYLVDGCTIVNGKLSYLHQDPWVFASTVHRNVVFSERVDERKYRQVIDVCCLDQDLERFPEGDRTLVGEKGVSLSGGQKARISLARTIYRQADIYLLDDPLSAVDAKVGKDLFEKCVLGHLAGKTRVLVLHQLQYLKDVDGIFHVERGKVEFYASYSELAQAKPHYAGFIAENVDGVEIPLIADTFQFDANDSSENINSRARKLKDIVEKNSESSSTESRLYLRYFSLGSGMCNQIFLLVTFLLSQIFTSAGDYTVALLSNSRKLRVESIASSVYVYAGLIVLTMASSLAGSLLFFRACLRSSEVLHDRAFRAVLAAPMSFFHANPSGRLLNRFSNDMGSVDEYLPKVMLDTAQIFLSMLGVILIACSVNAIIIAPAMLLLFLCLWLRQKFLVAAQNMRRLESTTKSPLLTYLNETLNGVCTIRSVRSEDTLKRDFDHLQDANTGAWYICLNSTFVITFSVELIIYIFTTLMTFGFVILRDHFSGSQVGLVITQMMSIVVFIQIGVRMSFESANDVLSVERILEYSHEKPEANVRGDADDSVGSFVPLLSDWPSQGEIRFRNVFLRYAEHAEPVLKDINLVIRPREKIGIVGRTGAGKSSLIAALFRLAKIEGVIEIDGIDTGKISLEQLRKNISIIPQDPVLFSGTLRRNLDPSDEFSDDELWRVLDEVELRGSVVALDAKIAEKGRDYSCGERQLLCLARAMLRKNRILLLDEATANVDPGTDALVQRTIRQRLADCTVLTIAHRLNTIIDSDRVAVMDNGALLEFDQPYTLLQREESHLSKLMRKTGDATFDRLFEQAKQFHSKKL